MKILNTKIEELEIYIKINNIDDVCIIDLEKNELYISYTCNPDLMIKIIEKALINLINYKNENL
jgi:hypothetical protein